MLLCGNAKYQIIFHNSVRKTIFTGIYAKKQHFWGYYVKTSKHDVIYITFIRGRYVAKRYHHSTWG